MSGDFDRRMQELDRRVGSGTLVASVVIDQPYAKYQHENLRLRHPRGGGAKYLYRALLDNYQGYMQNLARNVLRGNLQDAQFANARDLSISIRDTAPVELGDLIRSGAPRVFDGGALVESRPAIQGRLSRDDLRRKYRLRNRLRGLYG